MPVLDVFSSSGSAQLETSNSINELPPLDFVTTLWLEHPLLASAGLWLVVASVLLVIILVWALLIRSVKRRTNTGTWVTYKVKKGDTLGKIAKLHGTTEQVLVKINRLKQTTRLASRQLLLVPDRVTVK